MSLCRFVLFHPLWPATFLALSIKGLAWIGLVGSAALSASGYWLSKKYEAPPREGFVCFTKSAGLHRTLLNMAGDIIIVVGLLLLGICLIILYI